MKVLLVHPGASWSTADVEAGLRYGLEQHGVQIVRYRLDTRIDRAKSWLYFSWRKRVRAVAKEAEADGGDVAAAKAAVPKPTTHDMVYQGGIGALEMALHQRVDVVLIVSAMVMHPDVIIMMKRAGLRVVVLFTESPYDLTQELKIAALVDGGWTNERTSIEAFRAVNPNFGYLPHAWHPDRHYVATRMAADVKSHDVVFVGSGFRERVAWFNAIDWTGIDLGLYGTWKGFGLKPDLKRCVQAEQIDNRLAANLYRRAKVGINLYRTNAGWGKDSAPLTMVPESLSPRAYELAACGAFHISDARAEVAETFGDLVPSFTSPAEAIAQIRRWLPDEDGRRRVSAQLPACVAESSWVQRARTVIGDLQALLAAAKAAA
jgi:spore maturation protein CgeB